MIESITRRTESAEKPRRHVPQIAVIDFDRTLGDVHASMERFYNAAAFVGVDAQAVKEAQRATESDGGTFEPLSFVQSQLDEELYAEFKDHFITAPGPSLMYPEAQPFLDRLTAGGVPYVVRTWGVSEEWQHLKIAAAGYEGPYEVMEAKDKGAEINSWKRETTEGSIIVVPNNPNASEIVVADTAALIDDKATSFTSLEGTDTGFWLRPANGTLLESQKGSVPDNVQTVTSLSELVVEDGRIVKKSVEKKEKELPEGLKFVTELTDKHIEQLVDYSNNLADEGVRDNTSDARRFKDDKAVLKWIKKGRSITIITNDEGDLLGISWLGADDMNIQDRHLKPGFQAVQSLKYGTTFAIRTYEKARGKGLSGPLAKRAEEQFETTDEYKTLVAQGKSGRWLEVSASNKAGVRSYTRNGYAAVTEPNEEGKILMVQKQLTSPITVFHK